MKHILIGAALLAAAACSPAVDGETATTSQASETQAAPIAAPAPLGPGEQYGTAFCDAGQTFAVIENVPQNFDEGMLSGTAIALRDQWVAQTGNGATRGVGCQVLMNSDAPGAINERIQRGMNRVEWTPS